MLSVLLRYTDSDYPFGIFKLCIVVVLARLRVVDSDNFDEYKCLLLLNLFAASYNKTQSGNVYLMKIVCKSQFHTFVLFSFILKTICLTSTNQKLLQRKHDGDIVTIRCQR